MSVDDWARKQAEKRHPHGFASDAPVGMKREHFADGIVHAFDALLSDEAVEAAARALTNYEPQLRHFSEARVALQAAIDAVTKEARND